MFKLYNTQKEIASNLKVFLLSAIPDIRKTQLKIIPFIVIGMLLSESCVASDIAKHLKDEFSEVQHESVVRRITRFLLINFLILFSFMIKLFIMLFLITRKNIVIKEFILFLIICFRMIIILSL